MINSKDKNHPAVLAIKDYQFRKKINREDLADLAGVSLATLNNLFAGKLPTDATLQKIEQKLGIRLMAAYQMVAHPDLGEYPQSWCSDLIGDYLSIRQNRWLDRTDVINTFPVKFEWCNERPGLKMTWEFIIDKTHKKTQSGYVSITSKDGPITIFSTQGGNVSSTHLQRDGNADYLYGLHCGLGQISRAHKGIISQVVAYIRKREIDFKHDNQVLPGAPGHKKFTEILSRIEGDFCHMLKPPVAVPF